jgi:hypothetical protein
VIYIKDDAAREELVLGLTALITRLNEREEFDAFKECIHDPTSKSCKKDGEALMRCMKAGLDEANALEARAIAMDDEARRSKK